MRVIPARKGGDRRMSTAADLTVEEVAEFGDIFAELDHAKARLEVAAQKLAQRGYKERAHKVLGLTQAADAQKYLLVQEWEMREKAA
jgi:N-methylhydantoinase A/oxoprolinase/acetone carboxylase beta subunit